MSPLVVSVSEPASEGEYRERVPRRAPVDLQRDAPRGRDPTARLHDDRGDLGLDCGRGERAERMYRARVFARYVWYHLDWKSRYVKNKTIMACREKHWDRGFNDDHFKWTIIIWL